jgi:hypothetical protein
MKSLCWPLLTVALVWSVVVGCQNTEQSAVQPEKLATSTSSVPNPNPAGSDAPLIPFASGYGPQNLTPPPDASPPTSDGEEFNPDGAAPPATAGAPIPKPTLSPGEVKVVKNGAEPRQELRLTPEVGSTSAVEMVMTTEIAMEIDGKKPPTGTVPPIVFALETTVSDVKPNGDFSYRFQVFEASVRAMPGVQAEVITALNRALGALVGLNGTVLVSNRGITKSMNLELPGKQTPQTQQVLAGMEQALQQLAVALPEEAVGKGAQWTHTSTLTQNGISMTQVATYDLVKLRGKKLTCNVAVTQSAPKQKVASPVGVTVDLLSLSSAGGGTTKLDLRQLTPLSSKMTVATKATMGLPEGKVMKMDSNLTVEMGKPKKKRPAPSPTKEPAPAAPAPTAPSPAPAPPAGPKSTSPDLSP